jgi:hypothetical protein
VWHGRNKQRKSPNLVILGERSLQKKCRPPTSRWCRTSSSSIPNTPTALVDAKQYHDVLDKRAKEREAKARIEAEAAQAWNRIENTTDIYEVRSGA